MAMSQELVIQVTPSAIFHSPKKESWISSLTDYIGGAAR